VIHKVEMKKEVGRSMVRGKKDSNAGSANDDKKDG
jgi:hypothetical protein